MEEVSTIANNISRQYEDQHSNQKVLQVGHSEEQTVLSVELDEDNDQQLFK